MDLHLADGLAGGEHQYLTEIAEQPFQEALGQSCRTAAQYRLFATVFIAYVDADTVLEGHLGHMLTYLSAGLERPWRYTEIPGSF